MTIELGEVAGPDNPFEPELVSAGNRVIHSVDGIPVACHGSINEVENTDLIVVPALEKYCGHRTVRFASKPFLIDLHRGPQNSFAIFSTQKDHGDPLVLEVQEIIEAEHGHSLRIDKIVGRAAASRRSVERRFRAATGNRVRAHLQRVRVESAKKALESTNGAVATVADRVGYGDEPSFKRLFARITGLSPSKYRHRYALAHHSPRH